MYCEHTRCGGCPLIGRTTEEQSTLKENRVRSAFAPYSLEISIAAVQPAPSVEGHRRRVKLVCDEGRIGLFANDCAHEVIDIPNCPVMSPGLREVMSGIRQRLSAKHSFVLGIDAREVTCRDGMQVMLTFIVDEALAYNPGELLALCSGKQVASVFVSKKSRHSPQFLGTSHALVRGQETLIEEDDDGATTASAGSFVQNHREQAFAMRRAIHDGISRNFGDVRGRKILELYAGSGSLGLPLARAGASVTFVESFSPAMREVSNILKQEGLRGVAIAAPAETFLRGQHDHFDVVVVNPPRRGLHSSVRSSIAAAAPKLIAYMSCSPETLARDLNHFADLGYVAESIAPFDMIPLSREVECLTFLRPSAPRPWPIALASEDFRIVVKPGHLRADALGDVANVLRPLEEEASGLQVVTRDPQAAHPFQDSQQVFLAVVRGIARAKGIIRVPLPENHSPGAKRVTAITRYSRLKVAGGHTLVRIRPETDCVDQVQKHLAGIGHPILGDERYGHAPTNRHVFEKHGLDRLFLHCSELRSQEVETVSAPLTPDLEAVWQSLLAEERKS